MEKLHAKGLILGTDFIEIDEMILTVNEVELYNNAVNHPEKKIIILGEDCGVSEIMSQNPNLNVSYIANDINDHRLLNEKNGFVRIICAMQPNKTIRDALTKLGFVFGKDFYFHVSKKLRMNLPLPYKLLKKTMQDKPRYIMNCNIKNLACNITKNSTDTCCGFKSANIRLDSLAYTNIEEIFKSVFCRILQLSTANKTFCFCTSNCSKINDNNNMVEDEKTVLREKYVLQKPQEFRFSLCYDRTCNLKCKTCREKFITKPELKELVDMVHQSVIENINIITSSGLSVGYGEIFYSKYYKDIFFDKNPSKKLNILTNGTLFNEKNWQKIRKKYETIRLVNVSIDAANKDTYQFIREGANFDVMMKNLKLLSDLRKSKEIEQFIINFTISVYNFREMKDFVFLGRKHSCDKICFARVRNLGTYKNILHTVDVYNERNPHYDEFMKIVSDPIFKSVDVSFFDKRGLEHIFQYKENGKV
jgi:hypothetical protein